MARSPSDAVVALRSLGRRWRGLFAGLGDDEAPDDLAHRPGADGRSALDHAHEATVTVAAARAAVDQSLAGSSPDMPVTPAGGSVDDAIAALTGAADGLADRIQHVPADDWVAEGATDPLAQVWEGVDGAVASLKAAEATLREVRSQR